MKIRIVKNNIIPFDGFLAMTFIFKKSYERV